MTPAIGQRFTARWGSRYAVHRIDGDRVVLRDLDRPTACVIPTLDELAASGKYSAEPAAAAADPEIAPPPAAAAGAALLLVELGPAATGGRGGDRRPGAQPGASGATPAADTSRCCICGRRAIALVVVETRLGEVAYCSHCYGVTEHVQQREATGVLHTDWRPPPGEAYESRSDVGSFDPPPPGERPPPRPRAKPEPPPRVDAQAWLVGTGEVAR